MPEQAREQWGTRFGFLMAAIGSAIGLGNIWRFPYMCYDNGGGAFLIPYFVALFVVGVPLMMVEFGLGHYMKSAFPRALGRIDRRFSWIGWWAVSAAMFGITVYYSVIIAWCLCYLFKSFTLAWGADPSAHFTAMAGQAIRSEGLTFRTWVFLALGVIWAFNWLICYTGIQHGIERANKIFIPLLLVIVAVLVVWSCTQFPGAGDGLRYYFNFSGGLEHLTHPGVWIAAFSQIFFTLSLGFGIMIAYASYLPDDSNIPTNAFLTSVGNCAFSLFAGMAVFATIGYIAHSNGGVPVEELKNMEGLKLGGPKLLFETYPLVLSKIPGGRYFGVLFFAGLVVAGLSSSVSIVEAFVSSVTDRFKIGRRKIVSVLTGVALLLGIIFCFDFGLAVLDILDHFCSQYGLVAAALLECIIVGWIFTAKRLRAHLDDTPGLRFPAQTDIIMRSLITIVLAITWYGLYLAEARLTAGAAAQLAHGISGASIGIALARLLALGGVLLVWIDKHWLDFDIKIVIPALLIYLLDRAVGADIAAPYGDYPKWALWIFGVGWFAALLGVGLVIDFFFRRNQDDDAREPIEQ